MRAFAAAWSREAIVQQAVAPLPWAHHVILLNRLNIADQRKWSAAASLEHGWSRYVLVHQIDARPRERAGQALITFTAPFLPPTPARLDSPSVHTSAPWTARCVCFE